MATTRATEKGSQRATAVSKLGKRVRSQASKATRARLAKRMRAVCLREFIVLLAEKCQQGVCGVEGEQ